MSRLPLRIALLFAACSDRPLDVTGTTTTMSTGGDDPASTSTSDATTAEPPTTTHTPEPSTTDASTGAPATPDTSTTADTTTSTADTTTSTTGTTGETMVECGPPCGDPWVHGGELTINPGDDLTQFACLVEVTGHMSISGDFTSAELAVFANLRTLGDSLWIINDEVLTDLDAFACLETASDGLLFGDLPALTDASGLASVRTAPSLFFNGVALTNLPTLAPDYTGLVSFEAYQLDTITDLDSVAGWGFADDVEFFIDGAAKLTSIAGLAAPLAASGGHARISLRNFPALTSLAGLESLTSGSIAVRDAPKVPDLLPLSNLVSADEIVLAGMPKVLDLQGLDNLADTQLLQLGDCDAGFDGLGMVGLTDLGGLDSLTVASDLGLGNNTKLAALTGAPLLHSSEIVRASGNPVLTQADFDELLAQLDAPPLGCIGDWDDCFCGNLMP